MISRKFRKKYWNLPQSCFFLETECFLSKNLRMAAHMAENIFRHPHFFILSRRHFFSFHFVVRDSFVPNFFPTLFLHKTLFITFLSGILLTVLEGGFLKHKLLSKKIWDYLKIALILRPTDEIIILIATLTIVELESYE